MCFHDEELTKYLMGIHVVECSQALSVVLIWHKLHGMLN